MKQKHIFIESEGDAWFARNKSKVEAANFNNDLIVKALNKINFGMLIEFPTLLEIGCGNGSRLEFIKNNLNIKVCGIDPSIKAVNDANNKGVQAYQGTADELPFGKNEFDILVFGFCLYLCDREDLFKISYEADRVLKDSGWIIILDFYSEVPQQNPYHHKNGLFTYKMDYSKLFLWHPAFKLFDQTILHHIEKTFTDIEDEQIAISVIRKKISQ